LRNENRRQLTLKLVIVDADPRPLRAVWWMISSACDSWKGKAIWFVILGVINWVLWFGLVGPRLHPPHFETPYERAVREMHELFPNKS
jgi:hypothetical protein